MDPFDEFEMKPLTEGLGFHKKAIKFNTASEEVAKPAASRSASATSAAKREMAANQKVLENILTTLDSTPHKGSVGKLSFEPEAKITEPLPRGETRLKTKSTFDMEIPALLPEASKSTMASKAGTSGLAVGVRRSGGDRPETGMIPAPVSLAALILDGMVVVAMALVFLVALLAVTKVNLTVVIANAQGDLATQLSFGLLFMAVMQMYVVIARSICGRTLGEWTFDYQLGRTEQISRASYPILVLWRSLVIVLTGVVTLPLLSLISRRDLTAYLTGLALYRRA